MEYEGLTPCMGGTQGKRTVDMSRGMHFASTRKTRFVSSRRTLYEEKEMTH